MVNVETFDIENIKDIQTRAASELEKLYNQKYYLFSENIIRRCLMIINSCVNNGSKSGQEKPSSMQQIIITTFLLLILQLF